MMGPQRGNFSKDISWGDLGHAIQKACVDSSSGGGGGGADPDDDRKMPAKERPARRNTPNERFVGGGEAADPRQSMKMQMREKRDRLRQNFARSHSSGEDDVSWRDLTHSIEKAKWNSSVPDVGDLAGCDDGRTRSEPGGTMFESFKHLDAALERAMRDSLANGGGECGAERRATLGGGGGAGNGATLFESFRNLDEAMAQAMKNSLMDAADGHQWDAERNVGALEPMEEGEESDNDNDNDDDGNNDACGDVSSAADDHRTEIQNSKAKEKFTNLVSRGGGRQSMSSIASIKDTSGGNLDQIQRQLQGFSWSRDSGEDSDGAGVNSEVTPPQHRQLSLDSTSSDFDGNPPSSRPDATTSKHKRRASRNCVNSELSGNETASQSAAGKRSSFNHRIRRRDSSGSDNEENRANQDSSQSTAVDHPEPSVKHHPCDLHYSTRKGSLSDELESAVPTPRNKKNPGRTPNALSSSLSSPSQRHPACGAGRLTSSVIISSSSALRQGQSIPRSNSDDCQSDEAACATSKTSRIHDGIHARDGRNNLEAPPSTAPAKKKMGLKHIFGRSKSKHSS